MSQRLFLPTGRIEIYRKYLNIRLQAIRRRVSRKRMGKVQARKRGHMLIEAHYNRVLLFLRKYMKRKKISTPLNENTLRDELKEALKSWSQIVGDM